MSLCLPVSVRPRWLPPTASRASRSARLALGVVKLCLVAAIVVTGWATATSAPSVPAAVPATGSFAAPSQAPGPDYADYPVTALPRHVRHLLTAHDCSTTGFADETVPRSAVVRSAAGHLRHVDFDTGWRVYHRHGAATLVAVCRDAVGPPA